MVVNAKLVLSQQLLILQPTNYIKIWRTRYFKNRKNIKKKSLIDTNSKKKIAPGQFPLHYSPGIPLRTNVKNPKKMKLFY